MNFYIVDNGSLYLYEIVHKIKSVGHKVRVQKYSPFEALDPKEADVIILSGGMVNEVLDQTADEQPWFRHEFDLIQSTDIPILGICLGHQMIAVALGGTLAKLPAPIIEVTNININDIGRQKIGYSKVYALENHQFVVDELAGTGLIEIARSNDGIEMVYHPERKILGVQFHPEILVNEDSEQFFWDLIGLIHSPIGSHKIQ